MAAQNVAAMRGRCRVDFQAVLGTIGCLAGVGLILPGALNLLPILTVVAAAVVAVESILISGFYIYYGDRPPPLAYSVVMAIFAAFIAHGRFSAQPILAANCFAYSVCKRCQSGTHRLRSDDAPERLTRDKTLQHVETNVPTGSAGMAMNR